MVESLDMNSQFDESILIELSITYIGELRKDLLESYEKGECSQAYVINVFAYFDDLVKQTQDWHPYIKVVNKALQIVFERLRKI